LVLAPLVLASLEQLFAVFAALGSMVHSWMAFGPLVV
jgi:hypothetical protein